MLVVTVPNLDYITETSERTATFDNFNQVHFSLIYICIDSRGTALSGHSWSHDCHGMYVVLSSFSSRA